MATSYEELHLWTDPNYKQNSMIYITDQGTRLLACKVSTNKDDVQNYLYLGKFICRFVETCTIGQRMTQNVPVYV